MNLLVLKKWNFLQVCIVPFADMVDTYHYQKLLFLYFEHHISRKHDSKLSYLLVFLCILPSNSFCQKAMNFQKLHFSIFTQRFHALNIRISQKLDQIQILKVSSFHLIPNLSIFESQHVPLHKSRKIPIPALCAIPTTKKKIRKHQYFFSFMIYFLRALQP